MTLDSTLTDRLSVGDEASFLHTITEEEVNAFATLSGDHNLLHMDEEFASTTQFKGRVVHGMFLGALCSRLIGMHLPAKNCLYLKQILSFKQPAFIGDTVKVLGKVTAISSSTNVVTIMVTITKDQVPVMKGEAHVQLI